MQRSDGPRTLVTGGAGFIGSWIADYLTFKGHQVTVLDDLSGGYRRNWNGPLIEADLTEGVELPDLDLVIHCAAYAAEGLSHWMRRYCYTQNLVGWANLANACVEAGVPRIVALSSMAVYGSQKIPFTEDMIPQPEDPYGAAKAAMETDLKALARLHGISYLIVRPHNVYGPRQNLADPYRNVVAIFLRQALEGRPITVFGDGSQVRAFSYIEDVASAIGDLAVSDYEGIVNVGGEEPITILSLAEKIKRLTGSESEIVHLPPRLEVQDAYSDHSLLRSWLGGWDTTPLDWGLGRMAEWAKRLDPAPPRKYAYETRKNLFAGWT